MDTARVKYLSAQAGQLAQTAIDAATELRGIVRELADVIQYKTSAVSSLPAVQQRATSGAATIALVRLPSASTAAPMLKDSLESALGQGIIVREYGPNEASGNIAAAGHKLCLVVGFTASSRMDSGAMAERVDSLRGFGVPVVAVILRDGDKAHSVDLLDVNARLVNINYQSTTGISWYHPNSQKALDEIKRVLNR